MQLRGKNAQCFIFLLLFGQIHKDEQKSSVKVYAHWNICCTTSGFLGCFDVKLLRDQRSNEHFF